MTSLVAVRDAYLEQWAEFRRWCGTLESVVAGEPSAVRGWTVLDLVAHFARVADTLDFAASHQSSQQPMSISEYVATYRDVAPAIAEETRKHDGDITGVLAAVDDKASAAGQALSDDALEFATVVEARRGPIRWGDFVTSRCIELTVHVDDLGAFCFGT